VAAIAIESRGADLGAVSAATRGEAEIAAIGGCITQVWTLCRYRHNGPSVAARRSSSANGNRRGTASAGR
jgi:hypothetical protein